ncbi:hypothetical protein AB0B79_30415 [Streptomyces sp. NPDC039022]|uniref:hypothetical protein n=1 Tax=Streptomyces sp. NPDC039022 TaxID=3157091 RepID=UPI0033DBB089
MKPTCYTRTENGAMTTITAAEALAEINHAMMDGKRAVRTMTASGTPTRAHIEYRDGRIVDLTPAVEPSSTTEEPAEADDLDVHVVSVLGGKVHTLSPGTDDHPWPLCRGGMNQMLTKFRTTSAPLDCSHCVEYARRRASRANT